MINIKAFIYADDTEVALQFLDLNDTTLKLTATDLDGFIELLINVRARMEPPPFYDAEDPIEIH